MPTNDLTTSADADDASTLRAIRRRIGTAERLVLATAAGVTALFTAGSVQGHIRTKHTREVLLESLAAATAGTTEHQRGFGARMAGHARELAATPWKGDAINERAREMLAEPGVYLRITQPRATTDEEIQRAAKESAKDAFATCLALGVSPSGEDPARVAEACEPGSACLGERTGQLSNARQVFRGMSVFTQEWKADAETADPLRLGLLATDFGDRMEREVPRARAIVDSARYVLTVVDEVPEGTQMPWYSTGLAAVQSVPHAARIGLFDARTGEALVRLRLLADGKPAASPHEGGVVGRQVQGCSLGLDVALKIVGDARQ